MAAAAIAPSLQPRGKRSTEFISASVLPGSLQIRVLRGNIEAVRLKGVSQGRVRSTPGRSWSQVQGGSKLHGAP